MSLSSYRPERREVPLGGGQTMQVGALSASHLGILVRTHLPDLEQIVELFKDAEDSTQVEFAATLIQHAPGLVANVIALGAGEPDSAPQAQTLPFPVQIAALEAIANLTFDEVGGVKKFWQRVQDLLARGNVNVTTLPTATRAESSASISG